MPLFSQGATAIHPMGSQGRKQKEALQVRRWTRRRENLKLTFHGVGPVQRPDATDVKVTRPCLHFWQAPLLHFGSSGLTQSTVSISISISASTIATQSEEAIYRTASSPKAALMLTSPTSAGRRVLRHGPLSEGITESWLVVLAAHALCPPRSRNDLCR